MSVEVEVARHDERINSLDEKVGKLEAGRNAQNKRLAALERITNRNAFIVSYVERIGWAVITGLAASFTAFKHFFGGD